MFQSHRLLCYRFVVRHTPLDHLFLIPNGFSYPNCSFFLSVGTFDSEELSCPGRQLQAVCPAGRGWTRVDASTGMLLWCWQCPRDTSPVGPRSGAHPSPIFPTLSVLVPPTASDEYGLDALPAHPLRQAEGEMTLNAAGRSGRRRCRAAAGTPPLPLRLSRRLSRLAAVPGQDPPARRSWGREGERGQAPSSPFPPPS